MGCECKTILKISLSLGGLLLIGLGAGLGWGAFPDIVEKMVKESLDLTDKSSDGFENFITPPVPVYMKFTFFHVLNGDKVVTGEEKAKFEERGPYVYKEVREKRDITYDGEDSTMDYAQYRSFHFDEEMSCANCKKTDSVTILNMILLGAVDAAMKEGSLAAAALSILAKHIDNTENSKDLMLTDTVDNILFSGVNNAVTNELLTNFLFKSKLPPAIQDNGFAIFNSKNATTHNENYQVWTDSDRHSEIKMWGQDLDHLVANLSTTKTCPSTIGGTEHPCKRTDPLWWPHPDITGDVAGSPCNCIRGTNAEQFPPFVSDRKDEGLWIFTTDLCRSMKFEYLEEGDIDGIEVYKYSIPIDDGDINRTNNVCFCKDYHTKDNANCLKNTTNPDIIDNSACKITTCHDGLQNVENCMKSPVIMCSPHFFMAEQQLQHFDDSFPAPKAETDRTLLEVEPLTGMVLRAHKKIQVNMPITPTNLDTIVFLKSITPVPAFPVLWLDEGADIDQENIDKIKKMVTTPLLVLDIVKYTMIAFGAVMLLGAALLFCL